MKVHAEKLSSRFFDQTALGFSEIDHLLRRRQRKREIAVSNYDDFIPFQNSFDLEVMILQTDTQSLVDLPDNFWLKDEDRREYETSILRRIVELIESIEELTSYERARYISGYRAHSDSRTSEHKTTKAIYNITKMLENCSDPTWQRYFKLMLILFSELQCAEWRREANELLKLKLQMALPIRLLCTVMKPSADKIAEGLLCVSGARG